MGNPIVHDAAREVWVLGTSAADRSTSLQSLEAPDFSLPDLGGCERTLIGAAWQEGVVDDLGILVRLQS